MAQELLSILVRVVVMYLFALAMIRISGKQSIGELSTLDFIVITILGDAFDSVIYSEVSIAEGMVSFATIVILHLIVRFLASRSMFVYKLVTSPATVLIQKGTYMRAGMDREWINPETVHSEMRIKREDKLEEIKEATLEENGKLSVVHNKASKPVQKYEADLLP